MMGQKLCTHCGKGVVEEFIDAFACSNDDCDYYILKEYKLEQLVSINTHVIETETAQKTTEKKKPNKYQRECKKPIIDVYDVLEMFEVTNPATQHAIKKLLMPGKRGAKDTVQDLNEARDSIVRAIELEVDRLQ